MNFTGAQKAITECFLPALFRDILDEKDDVRLLLCGLPVMHAGMALSDPTKSAPSNYEASTCVNTHLIAALKGNEDFSARDHVETVKEVRTKLKGLKKATDDLVLKSVLSKQSCDSAVQCSAVQCSAVQCTCNVHM